MLFVYQVSYYVCSTYSFPLIAAGAQLRSEPDTLYTRPHTYKDLKCTAKLGWFEDIGRSQSDHVNRVARRTLETRGVRSCHNNTCKAKGIRHD